MADSTTTIINISLDEQVSHLGEMVDQVIETLKPHRQALPAGALDNLIQLSRKIKQVSGKIAQNEAERQDLLALAEISQVVNSSLELNAVLEIVMDTIVRLTGAERGFLMLRDQSGELETRIARNWEQESIHPSEFAVSRTIMDRVVSERQAILTTNAQEDPRFGGRQSVIAYSLRSILCVPMFVKERLTGLIYADNRIREGLFTEAELNLLNAFANQAAIAIENASLFENVRQTLAEVTELKNLMNNVFESIVSGVITADIEEKITLSNQAAQRILGISESEIIGQHLDTLLPAIGSALSGHVTSARKDNKSIVGQEFRVDLPPRGPVDLRFNISPLRDVNEATQGVAIVVDDLTEQKRLEGMRRMFERMVSPSVIGLLDPNNLQLGGQRREITTLFVDIRGFTGFSEGRSPVDLVTILNRYISVSADAILAHQGTIDKFLGDGIMAWFNAPIPQHDHAIRAIWAAIAVRQAVERLHKEMPADQRLSFGAGIDFGEAVLGLVGTENKLEYTAIGDSVNTAKRIQESSQPNQILISPSVLELVGDQVEVRAIEPVYLKGKSEPVQVYEVVDLK